MDSVLKIHLKNAAMLKASVNHDTTTPATDSSIGKVYIQRSPIETTRPIDTKSNASGRSAVSYDPSARSVLATELKVRLATRIYFTPVKYLTSISLNSLEKNMRLNGSMTKK